MLKERNSIKVALVALFSLSVLLSAVMDWKTGEFDFLKLQEYKFYFQSWVSAAAVFFSLIMSLTTFIIYKKNQSKALQFISLGFLLISSAYMIIGYHSSYCEVCSNLTMCSASHNYPTYLIIVAFTVLVLSILLSDLKKNIHLLKVFTYGLIVGAFFLLLTLFFSMYYMETPGLIPYVINTVNLQGFVFLLPLLMILLIAIYFKKINKLSNTILVLIILLIISFAPQAFHIFVCDECHKLECSEFYVLSGILMTVAAGFLLNAVRIQSEEKK